MQDRWSRLVEECRIGTVYRPIVRPGGTKYESHNPHIDLSDVPVFYWGEMLAVRDGDEMCNALDAIRAGALKLPYPRVAFLYHVSSDNPALHAGPKHLQCHRERVYAVVGEEEDDGSITCFSFMWHYRKMDHWTKQAWQAGVTCGSGSQIELSYDPGIVAPADFFEVYSQSNQDKILHFLTDLHRLMTHSGFVTFPSPGKETQKINQRRSRLNLPDVPLVRIIKFDIAVPKTAPHAPAVPGAPKRPHFRRGTYRTLATGRRVWVRPSAVRGGGADAPPPWYEMR
jgi:hypothetical protein